MSATPVWLWPNLLCLDAPLVALAWQDLAARSFGAPLHPAGRIALALTVWAVYLADRLIDIRGEGPAPKTARHEFARRHRGVLRVLLGAVLMLGGMVAVVELRRVVLLYGLALAGCVISYLSIFPPRASRWEKQIVAAVLFSAGVLLVPATSLVKWRLVAPAVLFAGLCLCNLVLIELWEAGRAGHLIWMAPASVAALALLRPGGGWQDAVAFSGVLLAGLAVSGSRLSLDARRTLADVALLAALLFR